MEHELSLEFLRVVEQAAIASARTMGLGDGHKSDQAAVEAMRTEMDTVGMDGTIVIGEGERDKAPMLYIGEKVGLAARDKKPHVSRRGYRRRSAGGHESLRERRANAIAVLAASEHGRLAACARSLYGKDHRRARRAGAPWIWMRRPNTTCTPSPSGSTARWKTWW